MLTCSLVEDLQEIVVTDSEKLEKLMTSGLGPEGLHRALSRCSLLTVLGCGKVDERVQEFRRVLVR